jgi:class 3 adenylate cyclase/CheY-like chemotaxis protein
MHNPPRILIVDDNATNRDILMTRLGQHGYDLVQAADGEEAIEVTKKSLPDLILLDVMMPNLDGIEATKRLKADTDLAFTPIILVTAKTDIKDVVAGLEAGADEYLTKPVDQTSLVARVKSMLRVKELHDKVAAQAADLATWNKTLEQRVTAQLAQLERVGRLKRFLAPQIADLILTEGNENLLDSHRRDITVVFGDMRGFTAFAETAEPEEVMAVLREYHANLGPIVHKYEGTVERFIGDGFLVLFNDPVPCPDPSVRAIKMAVEMRACMEQLADEWRKHGHDLGFGIGIAHGYATLGRLGFEGRFEYSAIGTVVNLAARLCAQAETGQILIDPKVHSAVEPLAEVEPAGELTLKGLSRPIKAFKIGSLRAM